MKKIGLVGGISWSSTLDYYRLLNETVNEKKGGLHFAECIIYSVNFDDFRKYNAAYDWDSSFALLLQAATSLERAGAEVLMLGANTAHIVAERIREQIQIPLVDIREATALSIRSKGLKKIALLGTVFTMEMDFYKDRLIAHGIDVLVPGEKSERDFIEATLVHELGKGIIRTETKAAYLQIIDRLAARGAEGIVLGCTEIPLLITQQDCTLPVFNTTLIHVQAATDFALA